MTIRTYEGETMGEALAQVKSELGRDAVIVQTRSVRRGRWLGLFGGRCRWEIRACPAVEAEGPSAAKGRYVGQADTPPARRETRTVPTPMSGEQARDVQPPQVPPTNQTQGEMRQLREMVQALLDLHDGDSELPAALKHTRRQLIDTGVDAALAEGIAKQLARERTGEQLEDPDTLRECLIDALADRLAVADRHAPAAEGDRPRLEAFIGPTGVGKTTTIAKLAASYKLNQNKRVGLITIDTYRIAAVDQLKTYAEIIDVPLDVVVTAGELGQALAGMADCDVVLLDTAGRSQKDTLRLGELSAMLAAAKPTQTHLVVPATANWGCVANVLERFAPLGVDRLIVSKLDEAVSLGVIVNIASGASVPLSYVTTGQDVPEDLVAADARQLAGWIAEGIPIEAH